MKVFGAATARRMRKALGEWYEANRRDLPWRRTQDPYRVWISEIMLQQTRVAAVIPYYARFLERFPTIDALASAEEAELLGAWAGLGYYTRARNLQKAARVVVEAGGFPVDYAGIRALPGVGDYTAAAVASICFGLPHAVLDGNVVRVMARLTGERGETGSAVVRRRLQEAAQELLDVREPARHNQAVMELGALVCVPGEPRCCECPVEKLCIARGESLERELPVKKRMPEIRRIRRTLLVAIRNGHILLWQRKPDAALLAGFWELPEPNQLPEARIGRKLHSFRHSITNHIYDFEVMEARVRKEITPCRWVEISQLELLPLSTVTRKALGRGLRPGRFSD
jgi:A/G-specific adenine glycosylase